ncbi:MAG: CAP domain-containing protein, partial [Candidatus Eremiobacteraeota bacterium]|nr:CAP domain-containing protein [Candidatus Eremiobacteraeota bacterium]
MCAYLLVPAPSKAQDTALRQVELEIIKRCNDFRAENGVPPFEEHEKLSKAARGHSAEMLELGYFAHTSPTKACEHLKDRLVLAAYYDLTIGENIYKCRGYDVPELAEKAVEAWIRSPVHRKNLLNPDFNRIGVGVVGEGDTYLFTQCFSFLTVEILDRTVRPKGSG